jgi:8-oxo-dGTP pyrophosphatase MutT (NUDIX family)
VRNISRSDSLWKFPGGGRNTFKDASPIETMARELREETGLIVDPHTIYLIEEVCVPSRRPEEDFHHVYYGRTHIHEVDLRWMRYQEGEDEEPRFFKNEELIQIPDLLPSNKELLIKHGLWPQ